MDYQEVLLKPLTTEKSTIQKTKDAYTFFVRTDANKQLVKLAVEKIFGVKVLQVNILVQKPKKKTSRFGRSIGFTRERKKAIVRLGKGQKIQELEV